MQSCRLMITPIWLSFICFTEWTLWKLSCTMVAIGLMGAVLRSRCEVQQMKSYSIAAAVLLLTAWPGSKVCSQESLADGKPLQQAQASSSPARLDNSVHASVTAKPAVAEAVS